MGMIKTVELNGNKYVFVNDSGNTRYGFYHISSLYKNDCHKSSDKVNYLNRTWECYQYQTVMKGCVQNLIDNRIERLRHDFMTVNMYKKMTAKRLPEFEKIVNNDGLVSEYRELKSRL